MQSDPRLARQLHAAFQGFAEHSLAAPWMAKEHNWVSLFAFRHLVPACQPGAPLHDPAQIGIEVGVAQPPGSATRATRRDLVIWPEGGMSCWDASSSAVHHPLAIIEWKVHRPRRRNPHVDAERRWLVRYAAWRPEVLLLAVELVLGEGKRTCRVTRIHARGEVQDWFVAAT